MKSRPILMSTPMVGALLAGKKTQTRRIVKPAAGYQSTWLTPELLKTVPGGRMSGLGWQFFHWQAGTRYCGVDVAPDSPGGWISSPYGVAGDELWVKETWGLCGYGDGTDWNRESVRGQSEDDIRFMWDVQYREAWGANQEGCHWRPSIFMPRWASRLTLQIADIRVERLQDITEEDALAEGVDPHGLECIGDDQALCGDLSRTKGTHPATLAYAVLWDEINGDTAPWISNPWVWAITFEVARP